MNITFRCQKVWVIPAHLVHLTFIDHPIMKKILVIAPHADDETLGCGGYLLHEKAKDTEIRLFIATIGGTDNGQDISVRQSEFDDLASSLDVSHHVFCYGYDGILEKVDSQGLTNAIDMQITDFEPDEVFCCYPSHHQDHKKLYDCFLASMRLKEGFMPTLVALYEYPFVGCEMTSIPGGRWYHEITDVINDKVDLFKNYKSQQKAPPSPLNEKGILTLAAMRGLESGMPFAEMFYIQKMYL